MAAQDFSAVCIALSMVSTDGGTQMRADLNEGVVDEYEAAIRDGQDFPPIILFGDGSKYWLGDGFHRFFAYKKAGALEIPADIRVGTKRDAILFSAGANANHGLRRTNEDKRKSVLTLLEDEEWGQWSDREIARRVGVTHPYVAKLRGELSGNGYQIATTRTVTRGGTTFELDTSNIGRQPAAEDPGAADTAGVKTIEACQFKTPEEASKTRIELAADSPASATAPASHAPAPASPTPPAHERLIAALDMLDDLVAADVIEQCPPRQRASLSQRTSSAIDLLGDVLAGVGH